MHPLSFLPGILVAVDVLTVFIIVITFVTVTTVLRLVETISGNSYSVNKGDDLPLEGVVNVVMKEGNDCEGGSEDDG